VFALSLLREMALMMEAATASETSMNLYQNKRRNNPKDIHQINVNFSTTELIHQKIVMEIDVCKISKNSLNQKHYCKQEESFRPFLINEYKCRKKISVCIL
jgi:hypothetical protein